MRGVGCVHWCSHAGYCGDGDSYRRGLDCRHRADVDPETLARATKEAEAQRSARYDATFVRHHGAKTFEQYKRGACKLATPTPRRLAKRSPRKQRQRQGRWPRQRPW